MAKRSIFKSLSCFGPGGAFISLVEQICMSNYQGAYRLGEPAQLETELDIELRENRRDFIDTLFNEKTTFATLIKPGKNLKSKESRRIEFFRHFALKVQEFIET